MKSSWWLVLALVIAFGRDIDGNDFSSFLSANASIAVVVDREYSIKRGENIMEHFKKILTDTIRENLKNGGLNVKYFTWSAVRLKKDFIAAITITDCKNTWKIYEATQITSILLISITDSGCPRLPLNRAIMIPIVGYDTGFPQMILDAKVQQVLDWKTGILLVDQTILNDNSLLVESVAFESSKNQLTPISLYLYQLPDDLRSQKKRIAIRKALQNFVSEELEPNQFLIFSKFYEDIIEVAEFLNLFHVYNQWFFFIIDEKSEQNKDFNPEQLTQNLEEGANIAFALNATEPKCVESLNCTLTEISMAFITSISRMIFEEQSIYGEISDEEFESIRFTKQEKQNEILKYMKDYLKENARCSSCSKWKFHSAITWGKSQEHKKNTFSALRNTRNKHFEFLDVGYWSPLLGFEMKEFLFPHIKQKFRNITMDIVTAHNPPWQILVKNSTGAIISHSGIVMEILKELSRMLNFTYRLYDASPVAYDEDSAFANETQNLLGSLTYLIPYQAIEMVQGSRYLIAAVAATIDEPDTKAFNYTIPISVQKYTFISRKPDEVSRIYLFTAPFTLETWTTLIGVILVVAPVLFVINYLVPLQDLKTVGLCDIRNCFWYVYGALLQQGGIYLPKADSGRMVVGVWWIVVIVLVTTYCGNLVAFLTFPKFQPGLDFLFQLFKHNEITQYGLRNGSFFQKFSLVSTREDVHRYMDHVIFYNTLDTEGLSAVEEGKRVNIDWRINLQLVIQNRFEKDKECRFMLGKENFLDEQIGLIMPSNSPYLHLINQKITRLFQMGFIERWHQTNLPSMDKCNGKGVLRQITNHKVNLVDMQGCFLVLLFGFAFAIFVIFIEYWYFRFYGADKLTKFSK